MNTAFHPHLLRPQLAFGPARTRELAQLRRLAPDADPFDRALIAEGRIRVLARDGDPVGAIGWIEAGAGRVALRCWFVLASERGLGHGRSLLDAAVTELRGAGHRWLDADAPATAVPRLVRFGFRAFGPAPFFVDGRPVAGVWMTREIALRSERSIV